MKDFSLKFIDIMIGVVLGLGFQWLPNLHQPWQLIAFIFAYFDIIDYWIDYAPSLKKFPPKRELDVMIDVAIMFFLFFYIYTTQLTIIHFLAAFGAYRFLDFLWLLRAHYQHQPTGTDRVYIHTWLRFNIFEVLGALTLIALPLFTSLSSLTILAAYIVFRIALRVLASFQYQRAYFA